MSNLESRGSKMEFGDEANPLQAVAQNGGLTL